MPGDRVFCTLKKKNQNICICIMRYLGDETPPMKFIYVSYKSYVYSSKVILYIMLSDFVHEVKFLGAEFSTCAVTKLLEIPGDLLPCSEGPSSHAHSP